MEVWKRENYFEIQQKDKKKSTKVEENQHLQLYLHSKQW